ncbi:hypothetical protein SAMN04488498_104295 [Mesorhizobium albiziae]|uniref:Uncharacterized protein n=1 Tax=Neomesorhizobium albiziae TaxID=335020 RepID=A0A1I3YB33_9HYPH|nr:hypothetical protein [Mesorhizobium albiziae]GLS29999.1 hypothetical protein GCM10007937_17070 [Mesorhizobium albiziae]SFK28481.1 hypothetical protein SAMN04488498_104295 [Mesorhizobium albiziae]
MRTLTILAASAAVAFATAASAQTPAQTPPSQTAPANPQAPGGAPTINTISIVDIKELPEAAQAQVNDVVAKRSDADLKKLRSSIDAAPQVKSALEAKGLTSEQVIAASMGNNGALTLITKKPG